MPLRAPTLSLAAAFPWHIALGRHGCLKRLHESIRIGIKDFTGEFDSHGVVVRFEPTIDQRPKFPGADQTGLQAACGQQVEHGETVLSGFLLEGAQRRIVDGQRISATTMVE